MIAISALLAKSGQIFLLSYSTEILHLTIKWYRVRERERVSTFKFFRPVVLTDHTQTQNKNTSLFTEKTLQPCDPMTSAQTETHHMMSTPGQPVENTMETNKQNRSLSLCVSVGCFFVKVSSLRTCGTGTTSVFIMSSSCLHHETLLSESTFTEAEVMFV